MCPYEGPHELAGSHVEMVGWRASRHHTRPTPGKDVVDRNRARPAHGPRFKVPGTPSTSKQRGPVGGVRPETSRHISGDDTEIIRHSDKSSFRQHRKIATGWAGGVRNPIINPPDPPRSSNQRGPISTRFVSPQKTPIVDQCPVTHCCQLARITRAVGASSVPC